MDQSFFFYDLETTGFNPRDGRIMQFGGQRTDLDLKEIGEPVCVFIKLTQDILPDPGAVLITGITPQQTVADGMTEAEFLNLFKDSINTPKTTFVGYNNVRFDDEFMRFLQYRNLYDPYTWQWLDGRSRWDLLDVVRMTRALRPEGISWPEGSDGKPSNRLELLSAANNLSHTKAHDALSDVQATIALARLIKQKQPKLFSFMFDHRDKKKVAEVADGPSPFVYTSGKYPSEYEKTTIVQKLATSVGRQGALVYDLRYDPKPFAKLTVAELAESWEYHADSQKNRLPVKALLFNRCPAIAPLNVLDEPTQQRLKLDMNKIKKNQASLKQIQDFPERVLAAQELLDSNRQRKFKDQPQPPVDSRLYDKFFDDKDREKIRVIHSTPSAELTSLEASFDDERLNQLYPLFLARNYPNLLSNEQRKAWEAYRKDTLLSGGNSSRLATYFKCLEEIMSAGGLTSHQEYLIEELQLWGESIIPTDEVDESD